MKDDPYADFRMGDNLKAVLKGLCEDLIAAQIDVDAKKLELEKAEAYLRDLSEKVIPEAAEGLEGDFDMGDGRKLNIKEVINASIAGERRAAAIKWLDDNGFGGIVKHKVIFLFDRNRHKLYDLFMEHVKEFQAKGYPLVITEEHNVHPQTLMAWVREKLKEGIELPKELLGIFVKHVAKIKD